MTAPAWRILAQQLEEAADEIETAAATLTATDTHATALWNVTRIRTAAAWCEHMARGDR